MAPIDLTRILTEAHDGKWVVLSEDYGHVIAASDSVDEIASYNGKGIIMKVSFSPVLL